MYMGDALHTDKKENQIFIIYRIRKFRNGAVAKSYMTNGPLIYGEIFAHFLICIIGSISSFKTLQLLPTLNFLIYIYGKFDFLFYQCTLSRFSHLIESSNLGCLGHELYFQCV